MKSGGTADEDCNNRSRDVLFWKISIVDIDERRSEQRRDTLASGLTWPVARPDRSRRVRTIGSD